jgi:hypothetical protein
MKKQQGLSLVELLIASLLGFIVLNGLYQLLLNAKQYYQKIVSLTELTSDAALTITLLTHYIKLTGFHLISQGEQPHIPFITNTAITATQDKHHNDILTLRFMGDVTTDSPLQDCLNRPVGTGIISVNTFFVDDEGLGCYVLHENNTLMRHLVLGVEAWRIRYGQYELYQHPHWQFKQASDPTLDLSQVRLLRIALVFRATTPSLLTPNPTRCQLFEETYDSIPDRTLRRCITFNVALTNHVH